jgi:hypothetical protein
MVVRGALFRNTEKTESSKQPDYRGDLLVNGVELKLSGWIRESPRGKFLSLVAKEEKKADAKESSKAAVDDEIGF